MYVNMMCASKAEPGLSERLVRLTGKPAARCVPDYDGLSSGIQNSPAFRRSLEQMRALADENRLLAMALLQRRKELCACEVQAVTGLTHATVSHHMSVLSKAGLVQSRRDGKWVYYRAAENAAPKLP